MEVKVIPVKKKEKPRICAYARVSTNKAEQEYSFVVQSDYWNKKFIENNDVEYVGLFSDEGISGKSMKNRKGIKDILSKVKNGEIDEVYTKSVSRFARNYTELIQTVREFRDLGVPIIFEKENINTLDPKCGLILSVMASLAEEELNSMSRNQKWAARKRFAEGSVEVSKVYGYDYINKKLIINPDEARVVKRIYDLYLQGNGLERIAKILHAEGIPAYRGGIWKCEPLRYILRNEKYIGNSLLQKYYSDLHVKKKNNGEITQYYVENTHEPIIPIEDYENVQRIMNERSAKYHPNGTAESASKYPLSGKIKCGDCGATYRRKIKAKGKTYECIKWCCSIKESKSKSACPNTDIKNDVFEQLLVESYNEAIIQPIVSTDVGIVQKRLQELLKSECELKELKVHGYISDVQYNVYIEKILADISAVEQNIKAIMSKQINTKKYVKAVEFNETVADFLVKAIIKNYTVTFEFLNGAIITKSYTNGRAGNVNGKLCKHKT